MVNHPNRSKRLGRIQRDIVTFLSRCGTTGGFIGSTTRAPELQGYDLEQVERACEGLLRRGIIRKHGICHVIGGAE